MTFTSWRRIGAAAGVGVLVAAALWSAGGVAGSDPVATIGRVAASPPDGLRFVRASLAVWATAADAAAASPASLAGVARRALGPGGQGTVSLHSGSLGAVRWAEASRGTRWSVAELTPAQPPIAPRATLVVMSGEQVSLPTSLSAGVASLAGRVRTWGAPDVAVCASAVGAATLAPLSLAHVLASRMGAVVTEAAGGPDSADLFARLPGAAAVAVAGRPINLEVRVTRTQAGLVVHVASPFVAPAGCTPAGDGALAA